MSDYTPQPDLPKFFAPKPTSGALTYTPTTEEVRDAYCESYADHMFGFKRDDFDRWLAEVKAQAVYDWVRLVQGKDNFTLDDARSFIYTMNIAEEDD